MNDGGASLPLDYLTAHGARAEGVLPLTWGVIIISVAVVAIIAVLVVWGTARRRIATSAGIPPVERKQGGTRWIAVGVGLSTIVLFATAIWTMRTLAAIVAPPRDPAFTVAVDARQWWWRVEYLNSESSLAFVTANEIRIPVGETVRVKLTSSDVIHSFWAPALGGKTDLIPGRTNRTWLHASEPGVYRGQCAEYCGVEHAKMGFVVVAMAPRAFAVWRDRQVRPASEPSAQSAIEGRRLFLARCSACHAVRGTPAGGGVGPDLTHVAGRMMIGAGTLPLNRENLEYWINHAQVAKPGNRMADLSLSEADTARIADYLLTLE